MIDKVNEYLYSNQIESFYMIVKENDIFVVTTDNKKIKFYFKDENITKVE
jgi:hypothetical protein